MVIKIYELTTNEKDGYIKYYVKGLNNEVEARALAKRVFGKKFYWDASGAIGYYDDYSAKWKSRAYSKSEFLKLKKDFNRRQD